MSRQVLLRESDCKKIKVYIDTDTSLAMYHDFVLKEKGWAVDKMVSIHQEQVKEAQEKMMQSIKETDSPIEGVQKELKQECASEDCAKE